MPSRRCSWQPHRHQRRRETSDPVALVLEVSGTVKPAVAPFGELHAGMKLTLDSGTRLRFVHYKSCRITRVRGGELTLLPSGHLLRDGTTESDEIRTCPKRLAAGGQSGVAGGLVMRGSGGGEIQLPPQPTLMFAGARAERFTQVLLEAQAMRVPLERASGVPVWRYAGPLLAPGSYRLVVLSVDGQRLVDEAVSVVPANSAPPEIAILRAD